MIDANESLRPYLIVGQKWTVDTMKKCGKSSLQIVLQTQKKAFFFKLWIFLASGRRSRPSRVKGRAWYHSNRLDKLIHLHPLDCLVMDIRWGKTWIKVENSSKKRFWPSKNRKPELLVSQSYGVWPWLSTDGPGLDSASTEHEKTSKNIKKSGTIICFQSKCI